MLSAQTPMPAEDAKCPPANGALRPVRASTITMSIARAVRAAPIDGGSKARAGRRRARGERCVFKFVPSSAGVWQTSRT